MAAAAAVLAPVMVTGSGPTRIPVAALVAPPVAAVVTGFLEQYIDPADTSNIVLLSTRHQKRTLLGDIPDFPA